MKPQPPGSGPALDENAEELRNVEWYWGKISREDVKNILSGKPDGSFLAPQAGANTNQNSTSSNTLTSSNTSAAGNSQLSARISEQEQLQQNASVMKNRLNDLDAEKNKLNRYIETKKEDYKALERQINSTKPELYNLNIRKEKYIE
ncbi:hypothetical protein EVAR_70894_1 [Eumeta japonica]|uniref:SH2 domain-containing protein n=1 Tax=Eumeta variegata TaxID=151549 RepID=A0A4C1T7Z6_EUMVA|nr:hypothetical protein EVAR_70894_1 [Eumeta japonica]